MPWRDELVESLGFGPRSMYVEMCWAGVLGPTATLMYRRLGSWAEFNQDGTTVNAADLAASLGLGGGLGRNSLVHRAIGRLIRFDAARWATPGELHVRQAMPPLPLRYIERLSYSARRLHEASIRHQNDSTSGLVR